MDIEDDEKRFKLHLDAVGIEEGINQESNILIYAANDQIFIKETIHESSLHESSLLRIMDMMGRIVLQQDISRSGLITIPVNLQTGVYVVMVQSGQENKTEKVFIK